MSAVMTDITWMERAACAGMDTDLFFPPPSHRRPPDPELVATALAACATCGVRTECHAYAVTHRLSGIWGGTTERDRGMKWEDQIRRPGQKRPAREAFHGSRSRYQTGCRCDECREASAFYLRRRNA